MSSHIQSRWYRAPEVSLVQKRYDIAADMWGIGCVIFELIYNVYYDNKDVKPDGQKKLAQGYCCYPLSPSKNENISKSIQGD